MLSVVLKSSFRAFGVTPWKYYLIHMLPDTDAWNRLCALGICDWIDEKRRPVKSVASGFRITGIPTLLSN
jgi:predicted aldo/keto reductase-like oxidoreductase